MIGSALMDTSDGTYVIGGLPEGSYCLRTVISQADYPDEWWAESASVAECGKAQSVTADSGKAIREKDFQIATLSEGDINGDGKLGLDDAILALKAFTGSDAVKIYTDADADGDGKIGMAELVYILQVLRQP